MAALTSTAIMVGYNCPACGDEISTLAQINPTGSRWSTSMELGITVDPAPIVDHISEHTRPAT